MGSQRNFRRCLATVVAVLALPQPQALAQSLPAPNPTEINKISPTKLTIEELKANQYFVGNQSADGTSGTASNLQELLAPPVYNLIPRYLVWQIRVRRDQFPSDTTSDIKNYLSNPDKIRYELTSDNGEANRFSNNSSNSTLRVTLKSREIDVFDDSDSQIAVVQGKVYLELDPSTLALAGMYKTRLLVCVKNKSDGCL
jgi:hypothetical protein